MEPRRSPAGSETTGIRIFAFLYYVAGFAIGVVLEALFPTDWPSAAVRAAVALVAAAGWLALDIAAIDRFSRTGTSIWPMVPTTALVTSGPYRLTRNPQYVGIACLYVAVAFAAGVMWALPVLVAVLLVVDRRIVAREEPYLEGRFGQEYRDYRARVRRWL